MLCNIRARVQEALYAVPAKRRPALRRSDVPDALLATDLPLVADAQAVEAFRTELADMGFSTWERQGWLLLDVPVPVPDAPLPASFVGECGCCISLLVRHPDGAPAEDFIRAVVKAADAGRIPFERLCGQLHAELAARLRRHEPLPGALLPYLCQAWTTLY